MNLFLDISLVILIVATVIICWRRGFIRTVLGAAKSLLAIVITFLFGPRVSALLQQRWLGDKVLGWIQGRLLSMFGDGTEVYDLSVVFEKIPGWLRVLLEKAAPDMFSSEHYEDMTQAGETQLQELAQSMAVPISKLISDFLGYVLVFLVAILALQILAWVLGKLADLPVLRTCDRLLGLLLGIVSAPLYASVYTVLIFAIFNMIEGANEDFLFHAAFEKTVLFRAMYEYNIFRWVFGIG